MSKPKKSIIEYRHYSLPINFPVLLLSGNRWRISDIPSGRLHFHNCLEIGVCFSDSGTMMFEDKAIPFREGDVTCVPRHIPHTTFSTPGTESLWVYLFLDPDELFKNLFRSSDKNFERPLSSLQNFNFILNKEDHPKVYLLATTIVEEMKQQLPNYQDSVKGLMLSLYIELLRIHNNAGKKGITEPIPSDSNSIIIAPVLDYIYKNYMRPISIDDLAALCNLSPTHFRRIFHETMGTTPLDFLNSTRIDEACKLLRSTDDSILLISEQVGFHSVSSFNRCFSKLMSNSPRDWRKHTLQTEATTAKASILEFTGWV